MAVVGETRPEFPRAPPLFPEPGQDLGGLRHALLPGEPAAATSR